MVIPYSFHVLDRFSIIHVVRVSVRKILRSFLRKIRKQCVPGRFSSSSKGLGTRLIESVLTSTKFLYMQTMSPSGCRCPPHYVLNSHLNECVRRPTGCSCPANYQLNQHNRCECIPSHSCNTGYIWDRDHCRCQSRICPVCSLP